MFEIMMKEASKELLTYPKRNLEWKLKNRIKKSLGMEYETKDLVNWPCGLLAIGLTDGIGELSEEEKTKVQDALCTFFDRWIDGGQELKTLEDTLSGAALLSLYEMTGKTQYRNGAHVMTKYLLAHERDEAGSLPYRPKQKNGYVLADMLGMVCPFLYRYADVSARNDWDAYTVKSARELAYRQLENFFAYGIDKESGLPFHGYVYASKKKLGLVGWGRAAGWVLSGLAAGLAYEDRSQPAYGKIRGWYEGLLKSVIPYQQEDGLFGWQLVKPSGEDEKEVLPHKDTSATAMILSAVKKAESALDRDDPKIRECIDKGITGIKKEVKGGKVFNASAECLDIGVHPQIYGAYPWSLGPSLSLMAGEKGRE